MKKIIFLTCRGKALSVRLYIARLRALLFSDRLNALSELRAECAMQSKHLYIQSEKLRQQSEDLLAYIEELQNEKGKNLRMLQTDVSIQRAKEPLPSLRKS